MKNRKMMYIIGGAGAAVIVLAIVLCLALGSCGDSKYDRYFNQAQTAFLERDYDSALQSLEKAIAAQPTAEAYLLMGEVYRQQGSVDMAIQVLYLGYSKTGDEAISRRLEELKAEKNAAAANNAADEEFKIAGSTVPLDSTSLLLVEMGLTDSDISGIGRLSSLESLSLSGNKLSSLAPLAPLSNLTFLEVSDNSIDDLAPLRDLTKLKNLYVDGNPITDFSPLHSLTSLRTLSMKNIDVTDEQLGALHEALPNCSIYADKAIETVSEIRLGNRTFMSDVRELDLSGDTITDLSPLAQCTSLERLELRSCGITDISSLVDLQSLTWLDISENEIDDLRALMSLGSLTHLDAHDNNIKDVTVLLYLSELTELDLGGNPLSGITSVGRLEKLTELSLRDTGVIDRALESLEGLANLRKLDLEQNKELSANKVDELGEKLPRCTILADDLLYTVSFGSLTFKSDALNISAISCGVESLDGLDKFKDLTSLVLTDNSISELWPIAELYKLQTIGLRGNSVSDLTPLSRLAVLSSLDLTDNSISDIGALSGCTALEELHLGSNSIRDVSALAYCRSLVSLELSDNEISDVSALGGLTSLTMLNLDNNNISDLTPLYTLKNLQVLYIHGNSVKLEEIENIRAALPACTVACDSFGPSRNDSPEAIPVSGEG